MENKITAIIVDDENLAREIIKKHLQDFQNIKILCECSNGFEGAKKINELKPDLLFLDIQMPKLTGFEMLELLDDIPAVIFTTAYDQYAIKAFEVSAVDYLLKPFSSERFKEAVEKAINLVQKHKSSDKEVHKLIEQATSQQEYLDRIVVKDGQKINIVQTESLQRIEALDDYVMLYTNSEKLIKQKTMKFFEEHLNPKDFLRIHRSHIVRIDFIKQIQLYEKESYRVLLKNDTLLPVSKSGYIKLKEIFVK